VLLTYIFGLRGLLFLIRVFWSKIEESKDTQLFGNYLRVSCRGIFEMFPEANIEKIPRPTEQMIAKELSMLGYPMRNLTPPPSPTLPPNTTIAPIYPLSKSQIIYVCENFDCWTAKYKVLGEKKREWVSTWLIFCKKKCKLYFTHRNFVRSMKTTISRISGRSRKYVQERKIPSQQKTDTEVSFLGSNDR